MDLAIRAALALIWRYPIKMCRTIIHSVGISLIHYGLLCLLFNLAKVSLKI